LSSIAKLAYNFRLPKLGIIHFIDLRFGFVCKKINFLDMCFKFPYESCLMAGSAFVTMDLTISLIDEAFDFDGKRFRLIDLAFYLVDERIRLVKEACKLLGAAIHLLKIQVHPVDMPFWSMDALLDPVKSCLSAVINGHV